MPDQVHKHLNDGVLSVLGLEADSFSRVIKFKVRYGNSILSDYIKQSVLANVSESIDDIASKIVEKFNSNIIDAASLEYEFSYRYKFNETFKELLEKKAEDDAKKLFDSINFDVIDLIGSIDLNDPNSFQGEIGEILLEEIATQSVVDNSKPAATELAVTAPNATKRTKKMPR